MADCRNWAIESSKSIHIYLKLDEGIIKICAQFTIFRSHAARSDATSNIGAIWFAAQSATRYKIHGLWHSEGAQKIHAPPLCSTAVTKTYFSFQDCIVFSSLYACHKDPKVWTEPESFKPERFLDENGKFSVKKDFSIPFGAGKRLCAGETFARNTLFLVAAALLQNFTFEMPEGHRMPEPSETMTGVPQFTPKFWIKFLPR